MRCQRHDPKQTKTPSTCKALDNKKAVVKVGAGSVQRAQANEQAVK